jgi:O-antigen ligase
LFCLAIALVPLVQLIPLPPGLWTALPNREPSAAAFEILGHPVTWMPISVSPQATWLSAVSVLPPVAIFVGTVLLTYPERRRLSLVVLAVGVLSVFVGLVQVAQGPSSPLRFFAYTNPTEAVGFFANRNHFAALLYSLTLVAAAWTVHAAMTARQARSRKQDKGWMAAPVVAFTVVVVLVAAQAMARSRAGLGLTIMALFGAFALALSDRRGRSGLTPNRLMIGAIAVGVLFAVQFALYRILERFSFDPLTDARLGFTRNTVEAAKAYMPLGSGVGTFVPVYGMFEKPEDAMINAYANHAHNDVVEAWLESGIVGLGLMVLFAVWLVLRSIRVWRSAPPPGTRDIDWSLARAATMMVGLVALHSFVDYPLRTAAMMAIMAFACALLIDPPVGAEAREAVEPARKRDEARPRASLRPAPVPVLTAIPSWPAQPPPGMATPAIARQEMDVEWPEAWRRPAERHSAGTNRPPSQLPAGELQSGPSPWPLSQHENAPATTALAAKKW